MPDQTPFARSRDFWTRLGYALIFGLVMGCVTLVFLTVIDAVVDAVWGEEIDPGFLEGEWWWILLMGGFGLVVGVLRKVFSTREVVPNLFEEASERRSDWRRVPGDVAISLVTLVGGMSLGPEGPLGSMGAALGTWYSDKRGLSDDDRQANVVSGMSGAFGGLFTAPFLSTMLVSEAGAMGTGVYTTLVIPSMLAATAGFAVVFVVAGQVFLDVYDVTAFEVEVWDFLVAIPLGMFGALLAAGVGLSFKTMGWLSKPLARYQIGRAVGGGLILGLIAFAFPLTLFSGSDQLGVAIDDAETLGAGLLLAVVIAKMLSLAISTSTGFIGGVIFPMIFMGGTAGAAVHQLIPDIPEALAVSCLFVAVPAASARIPFTMLVLAAISLTLGSPAAAAPAGLAGIVSYVIISGLRPPPKPDQPPPTDDDARTPDTDQSRS